MKILERLKVRIKRRLGVPTIPFALEALRDRGFVPATVMDVGAHRGDFARLCREVFRPSPRVVCFEPLDSCRNALLQMEADGEIRYIPGLVGAANRESVEFHEADTGSSVLSEHHSATSTTTLKQMRTLDSLIEEGSAAMPDLLKIDTQGFELEILKGCERSLAGIRVVLAELNFLDIHVDVPLAHEVIEWMAGRDFVPYDICSLIRRPLDGALWQADFLFVRNSDELRRDKRWG